MPRPSAASLNRLGPALDNACRDRVAALRRARGPRRPSDADPQASAPSALDIADASACGVLAGTMRPLTPIFNDLANAAHIRGDNRRTYRQRFDDDRWEILPTRRRARWHPRPPCRRAHLRETRGTTRRQSRRNDVASVRNSCSSDPARQSRAVRAVRPIEGSPSPGADSDSPSAPRVVPRPARGTRPRRRRASGEVPRASSEDAVRSPVMSSAGGDDAHAFGRGPGAISF